MDLRASADSWLLVTGDGKVLFQGLVVAGDVRSWTAAKQLAIVIGYWPGVTLLVNGRQVPLTSRDNVWRGTFTAGQ